MMKSGILLLVAASILCADVRVNLRIGAGHPIARPRTVIVRPAARPLVVRPNVVYAPKIVWTRTVIAAPPQRDRLVWEGSETLHRREHWVDTVMNVDRRGNALYLRTTGRLSIDFAEVHFKNGQVQVVDFNESLIAPGMFLLVDFKDGREVDDVRVIAQARSQTATFSLMMAK